MHPHASRRDWTLLFDADDTLWENSIFFEHAIARFIEHLDHRTHTPAEVRAHLDRCEQDTIAASGYGSRSFQRSLTVCFEHLSARTASPADHQAIAAFADSIAEHEIQLLQGVQETLTELATRHRLLLVTKGNEAEQRSKLHRSGLASLFTEAEVVREKDMDAYLRLITAHALDPKRTCMIGNSPRSDINPALAAGLHAVLIPHLHTWSLEHDELCIPKPGQMLLQLQMLRDLLLHF